MESNEQIKNQDAVSKLAQSQKAFTVSNNEVHIHTGEAVYDFLAEEYFQLGWDALYEACPWATVFQSRTFVTTWYQTYREKYLPILVWSVEAGRLTGLLALARTERRLIVGAGENQAEYQVWLATDTNSEWFIKNALTELDKCFPGSTIRLQYIPGSAPIIWASSDPVLKTRCTVRTSKQPLMKVDGAEMTQELKKKNRREKINRLKRLGDLRFERITDSNLFASIIDELAIQYDFRKMAMHNRAFFLNDPQRKKFLLSLFEQHLLHTTVLRLNGEIIASNVGVMGKSWLHLQGINTHAPSYAKYSPGILHFLMLGQLLDDEGIEVFDLTPGADSYKDALASEYGIAYKLTMSSSRSRFINEAKFALTDQLKGLSPRLGIEPGFYKKMKRRAHLFKEKMAQAKRQGELFSFLVLIGRKILPGKSITYASPPNMPVSPSGRINIKKNSLRDLLLFESAGPGLTRWEFLEAAMHRLEMGQAAYTYSDGTRLLGCVWRSDPKSSRTGVFPDHPAGEEAVLLEDFYCHPDGRNRLADFAAAVVEAAKGNHREGPLYVLAAAGDKPLCRTLESLGFTPHPTNHNIHQ